MQYVGNVSVLLVTSFDVCYCSVITVVVLVMNLSGK